jgi:hypothetical protein
VALALIGALLFFLMRRRKRRAEGQRAQEIDGNQMHMAVDYKYADQAMKPRYEMEQPPAELAATEPRANELNTSHSAHPGFSHEYQ